MVSILIFSILLTTYYGYISMPKDNSDDEMKSLLLDSRKISDSMVSEGYPSNWTTDNVLRIGIADADHRINISKLDNLVAMGYNETRQVFGTYANFYLYLEQTNGSRILLNNSGYSLGINSTQGNANHVLQTRRILIYNQSLVVLNLQLWRP